MNRLHRISMPKTCPGRADSLLVKAEQIELWGELVAVLADTWSLIETVTSKEAEA